MEKVYVIDACALIAYLKGESGGNTVKEILKKAQSEKATVVMHKLNLLEVYYGFYRERGKEFADEVARKVACLISVVSEISEKLFKEAGRLKSSYKISLADSIALAETLISNGTIVTSDHHEFDVIEKNENISFLWIR